VVFLPSRESAGVERRELATRLRADIAGALGIALQPPEA